MDKQSITFVLLVAALSCTSSEGLQIDDLRVNYLPSPLGVDTAEPHFSWKLTDSSRGAQQDNFRLLIEDESGMQLHDTGVIRSNASTFVTAGLTGKLKSNTLYSWTVQLEGVQKSSSFRTGLLEPAVDWTGAEWLESSNGTQLASQMRLEFGVAEAVHSAMLYVCVPGYGTVSVNGARVDGGAGIRSWSQYDVRALYSSYDVSELIQQGNNTLGVYTGRGWYSHFGYGPPTTRAVLLLTLASGAVQRVVSDGRWMETAGPVLGDDEYNGESYDARLETPGWDAPGFSPDARWKPVRVSTGSNKLEHTVMGSACFPAVEKIQSLPAQRISQPAPGVFVVDFEQNLSGWCRIKLQGPAGTRVQIRHAEALMHPPYGPKDGSIYVGNLRGAQATDVYILKGDPEGEVWEPLFTQHGFRYAELTGFPGAPSLDSIEAVHVRSAVEATGSVSFSDELLNQVQHNLYWGQSTNLMMVPTDCDQRDERLGWTGDSALTAEEALMNFDMGAFYANWAQLLDETSPNGAIGCTVPGAPGAGNVSSAGSCDASWSSVYPSVLHGLLKYYGDVVTPELHWGSLTRFIDNEYSRISSGGVANMFANFGDWVPPPPAPKVSIQYTSTFSFLNDLRNVVFMATKLGHPQDAARYQAIFNNVSSLFHTHWFNSSTNLYADGGQTALVAALQLGVVPERAKPAVLDNLVRDIGAHGNHTSCGIIGWRFQCEVLSSEGHGELAYALMTQRTYPSYGFEITHPDEPATTIWELWNGPSEGPGMNSRDHIMFGGPGAWLYSYLGGISQTADSIGFEHAVFSPPAQLLAQALSSSTPNSTSSPPLQWATASKSFPRGLYSISWQLQTSSTCTANLPEGSSAVLLCPGSSIESVLFASYGTPTGSCEAGLRNSSCNADVTAYVSAQCVGKDRCAISCSQGSCGSLKFPDPCLGTPKHLSVHVGCASGGAHVIGVHTTLPANAVADTRLPCLGATDVNITEGGTPVWSSGKYMPGAAGVTGAVLEDGTVVVSHGSGQYQFEVLLA